MKGFVGALAVTGSFLLIADAAGQTGPRDELKGWLRELVLKAKASGRSQIEIPAPQITPPFVDNLFTVGEQYTVIIGQPTQIVTSVAANRRVITTWYKLKVSEVVTKQPTVPSEPSLEQFGLSAALLPLATDEVLVGVDGGSIVSDGVTVLQHSPYDPRLQLNRQYVLTVYLEGSGAIASLAALNDGVFELQSDGSTMVPIGHKNYPLVKDIYIRTGNNLEFLRKALKEQRR
jgi:hypothetical protein